MATIQERAEIWARPISDDAPCGDDCRYEDEFEQIDAEIKKLNNVVGGPPDWALVVKLGTEMLRSQTKDTTVISSVCVALYHHEGWEGLGAGLTCYCLLVQNYWDQMFPSPRRLKGRAGDYTWMVQQLAQQFSSAEPGVKEYPAMALCLEQFEALDAALRDRFNDLHPAVGNLRTVLQHFVESNRPVEAPPEPEAEADAADGEVADWAASEADQTPQEAAPASGGQWADASTAVTTNFPTVIRDDTQAEQVVEQATEALKRVAAYYEKRRELWETEKKRIEDQLAHAGRIIQIQEDVTKALNPEEEDAEDGEGSEDSDD